MKALAQCHKRDNQFRGIAQRGIEQRTNAGTDMGCQMLGAVASPNRPANGITASPADTKTSSGSARRTSRAIVTGTKMSRKSSHDAKKYRTRKP